MIDRAEIIRFVEAQLGFTPSPTTKFFWETGASGIDASVFMEEFAKHYRVDMKGAGEGFDYGDSDVPLADALSWLWRRITFRSVPAKKHFTVDHLVDVANQKKWFDPVNG